MSCGASGRRVVVACSLVLFGPACVLVGSTSVRAAEPRWSAPVAGAVQRPFSYGNDVFSAGAHRGLDLGARPGGAVRAPCSGTVVFAGRLPAGSQAVSIACGRWRATLLPLSALNVRSGYRIERHASIGTVGRDSSHAGLHLGVRKEGDRWGYVDPAPLIADSGRVPEAPPPSVAPRAPRASPPAVPAPPARTEASVREHDSAGRTQGAEIAPGRSAPTSERAANGRIAPPAAWLGVALLLGVAVGSTPLPARARISIELMRTKKVRPLSR